MFRVTVNRKLQRSRLNYFYKNFLTVAIFFSFFFFLNLLPIMEKLLVAENKSYEAYRTNSNKQALSETPENGLRFARFFNASIVSVKRLKTRQRSIRVALLGEKTPIQRRYPTHQGRMCNLLCFQKN